MTPDNGDFSRLRPPVNVNLLRRRCRETGCDRDPWVAAALNFLMSNPNDPQMLEVVREALAACELQDTVSPDPFRATNPVSLENLRGTIGLGFIPPFGVPWMITPEMLMTHLLLTGRSGGGKTTIILLILIQLLKLGFRIKIFDRKLDYAALVAFDNFVYWQLDHFFTNWLAPPPGISFRTWINQFFEIFGNYEDIRVATRGLLAEKTLWIYDRMRKAGSKRYPTLKDVYHVIAELNYPRISNMARHQETIMNRMDGLFAVFGDHICSHRQLDWKAYLEADWAISLNGIPSDFQNLFITVEIAKIYQYRVTHNLRSRSLADLIVFDEASTMFKKFYEVREGTYVLTDLLAKSREWGIGFVIGTQTLSGLADSVMANTAIKIMVGGAGLREDYDAFAGATGMTLLQKEFLKRLTIPGQACARDPRYPYPFTLEVPNVVK